MNLNDGMNRLDPLIIKTAKPVFSIGRAKVSIENNNTGKRDIVYLDNILESAHRMIYEANNTDDLDKKLKAKALFQHVKKVEAGSRNYLLRFLKFLGIKDAYASRDASLKYLEKQVALENVLEKLIDKIDTDQEGYLEKYIPSSSKFQPRQIIFNFSQIKEKMPEKYTTTFETNFKDLYNAFISRLEKVDNKTDLDGLKKSFEKLKELDSASRNKGIGKHAARERQVQLIESKWAPLAEQIKIDEKVRPGQIWSKVQDLNAKLITIELEIEQLKVQKEPFIDDYNDADVFNNLLGIHDEDFFDSELLFSPIINDPLMDHPLIDNSRSVYDSIIRFPVVDNAPVIEDDNSAIKETYPERNEIKNNLKKADSEIKILDKKILNLESQKKRILEELDLATSQHERAEFNDRLYAEIKGSLKELKGVQLLDDSLLTELRRAHAELAKENSFRAEKILKKIDEIERLGSFKRGSVDFDKRETI